MKAQADQRQQAEDLQARLAEQSSAQQAAQHQLEALQAQLDEAQTEQAASQAQIQALQAEACLSGKAVAEGLQQQLAAERDALHAVEEQLMTALQEASSCRQQAAEVHSHDDIHMLAHPILTLTFWRVQVSGYVYCPSFGLLATIERVVFSKCCRLRGGSALLRPCHAVESLVT